MHLEGWKCRRIILNLEYHVYSRLSKRAEELHGFQVEKAAGTTKPKLVKRVKVEDPRM
jgi:hypothetical protein